MLSAKEVSVVYETLLSSPGMSDSVKIAVNITRKNALLLAKVISLGLNTKKDSVDCLLTTASNESVAELGVFSSDLLQRAGLTETYEKLNSLQPK